jgi:drug/metabolite transporter (DMT)-like permease
LFEKIILGGLMKKNNPKSIAILFLTAIIWGLAFSAQVDAAENGVGAFTFTGIRFLIASVALIPVILVFEREKLKKAMLKTTALPAALAGLVLFTASALQQIGIGINQSAGKSGFITGLYIVLVPIVSLILFKSKTSFTVWIGAVLALGGLYFLGVTPGESVNVGDLFVLASAFFWTAHILIVDRFIANASPIKFSAVQFFVCGIVGTIIALVFEEVTLSSMIAAKWSILYAAVFSAGVGYPCQIIGQKGADPTVASIILSCEALFGAIGGVVINGEVLSNRAIIGCVLMFMGIIASQIVIKKKTV